MKSADSAVQIIHVSESRFRLKKSEVSKIYENESVANLPLVILCIAGAARKGKSFLLNFFLDYLTHLEKYPEKEWKLSDETRLMGFEFREGDEPTTMGIWAWSHVFVIKQNDGKKVAVSLIDSQGTFDNKTTYQDCSTIFAMTCMFSSVMCFNVFTDLQEDKLNDLAAFIQHGQQITNNLGGTGKLFQDLVFIIRDCCYSEYLEDEDGGTKYIEKVLNDCQVEELKEKRRILNSSFDRRHGFVFPHPGEKVALKKTSVIGEMNTIFVEKAKRMIKILLTPKKFQVKRIGSTEMCCKDFCKYVSVCIKCFEDNKEFAPQAVHTVNREFIIKVEVERALLHYNEAMDKIFVDCNVGYDDNEFKKLHNEAFFKIKNGVLTRIKNEEISNAIIKQISDEIDKTFLRFKEQNNLLIENEKKRLQIIQDKRRHEEVLAKEQAEAEAKLEEEKHQRECEREKARQQRENDNREFEKSQAEAAAMLAKVKREHEIQRAEARAERQRAEAENERRRVEMNARHEEERLKREREFQSQLEQSKRELEARQKESEEKQKKKYKKQMKKIQEDSDKAIKKLEDDRKQEDDRRKQQETQAAVPPPPATNIFDVAREVVKVGIDIYTSSTPLGALNTVRKNL